jgi:hypothetical protein
VPLGVGQSLTVDIAFLSALPSDFPTYTHKLFLGA